MRLPLPQLAVVKLADMLQPGKNGDVVWRIRDGRIVQYEVTETGRIQLADTALAQVCSDPVDLH